MAGAPGAGNPQAFSRDAYGFSNPLKYTDPSGHKPKGQGSPPCGYQKICGTVRYEAGGNIRIDTGAGGGYANYQTGITGRNSGGDALGRSGGPGGPPSNQTAWKALATTGLGTLVTLAILDTLSKSDEVDDAPGADEVLPVPGEIAKNAAKHSVPTHLADGDFDDYLDAGDRNEEGLARLAQEVIDNPALEVDVGRGRTIYVDKRGILVFENSLNPEKSSIFPLGSLQMQNAMSIEKSGNKFSKGTNVFRLLSLEDKEIVLMCLNAAISKVYFAESEIFTVFGVDERVFQSLIDCYPDIDDSEENVDVCWAINNSMNTFCFAPTREELFRKMFNVPRERIDEVFSKWRELKGYSNTGH